MEEVQGSAAMSSEVEFDVRVASRVRPRDSEAANDSGRGEVSRRDVETLARLAAHEGRSSCDGFVDGVRRRPVAMAEIYVDLLQGAARLLGEWWVQDRCTFADVTIGTGCLQAVMRDLGPEFRVALECGPAAVRVLLAPAPGEQHTFGLCMVADFFIREGMDVCVSESAEGALVRLRRGDAYEIAGLSAGCHVRLTAVAECVAGFRAASSNRRLGIMVGGPVFVGHPEYAARVGADATATDGRDAARVARELVASIMHPS